MNREVGDLVTVPYVHFTAGEQAVPEDLEAALKRGSKALLFYDEGQIHTEMLCWTKHGKLVIVKESDVLSLQETPLIKPLCSTSLWWPK